MIELFLLKHISIIIARSAWSRATIPFEVGDIPDEQAIKFLQDFKIDPKIAEHVVKYLTGGRFSLLKRFLSQHKINHGENSFESMYLLQYWFLNVNALFRSNIPIFIRIQGESVLGNEQGFGYDETS